MLQNSMPCCNACMSICSPVVACFIIKQSQYEVAWTFYPWHTWEESAVLTPSYWPWSIWLWFYWWLWLGIWLAIFFCCVLLYIWWINSMLICQIWPGSGVVLFTNHVCCLYLAALCILAEAHLRENLREHSEDSLLLYWIYIHRDNDHESTMESIYVCTYVWSVGGHEGQLDFGLWHWFPLQVAQMFICVVFLSKHHHSCFPFF